MDVKLMQGNEACILGALKAGMDFYSGYPITPSTEIAEIASRVLPERGGVYLQMEDEIASLSAAVGASFTGASAMTATSGPGFSLMQEMMGYAVMAELPLLVAVVMRVGPSTGLPTAVSQGDVLQVRWGTHGDHSAVCMCPTTVEELYYYTIRAFELAKEYRTPVVLLSDAELAHMKASVSIKEEDSLTGSERFDPARSVHKTGLVHDERGLPTNSHQAAGELIERLNTKVQESKIDRPESEILWCDDAEYLLVAYGSTAGAAKSAVRMLRGEGLKIGLYIPKLLWPFRESEFSRIEHRDLKGILVAELNHGQYVLAVRAHLSNHSSKSVMSCTKCNGEPFYPKELAQAVKDRIGL